MSLISKINLLYDSEKKFFSLADLRSLLGVKSRRTLENNVQKLVDNHILQRLERGKYLLTNQQASDFEIAQFLYSPSYISFETALNYHGILSQFPFEISSVTTKKRVTKTVNDKIYTYYHINPKLFTGYYKNNQALIAYPEKALFDQLYFTLKSRKTANFLDELDWSLIDKEKFLTYFDLLTNKQQRLKMYQKIKEYFNDKL